MSGWLRMAPGLALAAWMIVATSIGAANPLPQVAYDEDHPVLAYYYNWWGSDTFGGTLQQPVVDYAASDHVQDHIAQALDAGINGFIANRAADLPLLLKASQGSGFRVTLQVDTPAAIGDVAAFYALLDEPRLVRYQGRPVLFFWATWTRPAAFWDDLRERVDPEHRVIWLADGDNFGILGDDAWDGISPYAIAWSNNPAANLAGWAAKARANGPDKLFVPPVSPGCDDSRARVATCIQDRAAGAYYQRSLDAALAIHPRWAVVVSTWNEWMENTQVEPSVQEGDLCLTLTRQFATTFQGASARELASP
jgi:Glycosyl hydrolase family 99